MTAKVRTCLWYDGHAEASSSFYVSLIAGSAIDSMTRLDHPVTGKKNGVAIVHFTLAGTPYMALDGGPEFKHTEAASIVVSTADQTETDRLWAALTADGGAESACGWLKDKFGLSWQIVPEALLKRLTDPDRAAAGRANQALHSMRKIDIAGIEKAFRGD
jgi:2-polyprenyl-6-hydroxyphenyl methylase/3-demethylubiquinone-9 3-methyltransferase